MTPSPKSPQKTIHHRRILFLLFLALIIGFIGLYLFLSMHNDTDDNCHCLQCLMNRAPEEGEYLYNRYLPLISFLWILLIFLPVYFINHKKK